MTTDLTACVRCHARSTHVVVDNVLRDPDTLVVNGGPLCLDVNGLSMIGKGLCDVHADDSAISGYTLEELGSHERLDAAILAHRKDPTDQNAARVQAAAADYQDRFFRRQATEFVRRTRADHRRTVS